IVRESAAFLNDINASFETVMTLRLMGVSADAQEFDRGSVTVLCPVMVGLRREPLLALVVLGVYSRRLKMARRSSPIFGSVRVPLTLIGKMLPLPSFFGFRKMASAGFISHFRHPVTISDTMASVTTWPLKSRVSGFSAYSPASSTLAPGTPNDRSGSARRLSPRRNRPWKSEPTLSVFGFWVAPLPRLLISSILPCTL